MIPLRRVIFISFYILIFSFFYFDMSSKIPFISSDSNYNHISNPNIEFNYISSDGNLYIKNLDSINVKLDSIIIRGEKCGVEKDLSPGLNEVDISNCLQQKISSKTIIINGNSVNVLYGSSNNFRKTPYNQNSNEDYTIVKSSDILEKEDTKNSYEDKSTISKPDQLFSDENTYEEDIKVESKSMISADENVTKEIVELREELEGKVEDVELLDCSNLNGGEWISIPGNSDLQTSNFCVMKYEAKCLEKNNGENCNLYSDTLISQAKNTPWTNVTYASARMLCDSLGDDYQLISNAHWTTIARIIEVDSYNWANGIIGSRITEGGGLYRGNVYLDDSISCGNNSMFDGYGLSLCAVGEKNKRRFRVMNDFIWDLSGNAAEWTIDTCNNQVWYPMGWREWGSSDLENFEKNVAGPIGEYDFTHGVGKYYGCKISGNLMQRGGNRVDKEYSGLYSLTLYNEPLETSEFVGFRCIYS